MHRALRAWFAVRAFFALGTLGLLIAWGATLRHNAWQASIWPRYVCVDGGSLMLLSTLWRPGPGMAWQSDGWIYDALRFPRNPWWSSFPRIGTAYPGSGGPGYTQRLDAVSIPLWNLAIPLVLAAVWAHGRLARARRFLAGVACSRCGYLLAGLFGSGGTRVCPECGAPNPGPPGATCLQG